MMPLAAGDVKEFRARIIRLFGLHFEESKRDFLGDVLRQRMEARGQAAPAAYFQSLETSRDEARQLAEILTVTETFFFRNNDHFRALVESVLPEKIRARATQRRLRILSAGCASGEEIFTWAMLIRENFPELLSWDLRLLAVDINPAMLARAGEGLYSAWALRDTPDWAREHYFRAEGREFRLDPQVRSMAVFEERNLSAANSDLWLPHSFDVIFCRNVIMYFVPQVAAALVARMAGALAEGGHLFLGHAETLRGLSHDFHLCHTHDTFYYQRRSALDRDLFPFALSEMDVPLVSSGSALPLPDTRIPWMDAIQRASENIASLAARSAAPGTRAPALAKSPTPTWDLGLALDLLRRERFSEALDILRGLPPEAAGDPDVLLLRAVLLTNMGDQNEAEALCRRLLLSDELNAGAHYLTALCREHAGDRPAAEEHDLAAIYLDPAFAMPWLHLGLMSKRGGRAEEARRYLEQALALLAKDDSSRVLLFGGGFSREALAQVCRSEVRSLS